MSATTLIAWAIVAACILVVLGRATRRQPRTLTRTADIHAGNKKAFKR